MKEERKSKANGNKENQKIVVKEDAEELPTIEFAPPSPKKNLKQEQEEKELLEVSLLAEDDDFLMEVAAAPVKKPEPVVKQSPVAPKTLTAKAISSESTIFNELQGIDFDAEIREENEGKIDWTTVSRAAGAFPTVCFN